MRKLLVVAIVLVAYSRGLEAQQTDEPITVVVFGEQPNFIGALRIQLAGQATVTTAAAPAVGATAAQISASTLRIVADGIVLAVWFDASRTVFAHERGSSREAIVILPSETDNAHSDRELALKVSAIVDDLGRVRATAATAESPAVPIPIASAIGADTTAIAPSTEPRARRWRGFVVAAGAGAVNVGAPALQAGLSIRLGASANHGRWRLRGSGGGQWMIGRSLANAAARATLSEFAGSVRIEALVAVVKRLAVGAQAGGGARRVRLEARTSDNAMGSAASTIPIVDIGSVAEVALTDSIAFSISASIQLNLIAETLTVRGDEIAALERARFPIEVGIVVRWPQ